MPTLTKFAHESFSIRGVSSKDRRLFIFEKCKREDQLEISVSQVGTLSLRNHYIFDNEVSTLTNTYAPFSLTAIRLASTSLFFCFTT